MSNNPPKEAVKKSDVAYLDVLDAGESSNPSQRYRTKLRHQNGNDLFISTEGYRDEAEALRIARKAFSGEYEVRES